jgi:hypothetical protein
MPSAVKRAKRRDWLLGVDESGEGRWHGPEWSITMLTRQTALTQGAGKAHPLTDVVLAYACATTRRHPCAAMLKMAPTSVCTSFVRGFWSRSNRSLPPRVLETAERLVLVSTGLVQAIQSRKVRDQERKADGEQACSSCSGSDESPGGGEAGDALGVERSVLMAQDGLDRVLQEIEGVRMCRPARKPKRRSSWQPMLRASDGRPPSFEGCSGRRTEPGEHLTNNRGRWRKSVPLALPFTREQGTKGCCFSARSGNG